MKYYVVRVYPRIGFVKMSIVKDVIFEANTKEEAERVAEWFKSKLNKRDPSMIYVCEEKDIENCGEEV